MEKKKNFGARTWLKILCVFLAVLLVLMIAGAVFLEMTIGKIGRVDQDDNSLMSSDEYLQWLEQQGTEDPDYTGATVDPEDVTWGEDFDPITQSKNVINILLIGQDRREGEERQRSDAMILCTVNKTQMTLTLTSLMRDMYVQIPGYQDDRINACYQLGGMELLDRCLYENFGITVDGNIEVDFTNFIDVVDILGGVDIKLTAAEARLINAKGKEQGVQWSLTEGVNHLDGAQALQYSRMRNIGNGDFDRTARQRKVVTALVNKAKGLSLLERNGILQKCLPLLTTDLTDSQILNYSVELLPLLGELEIKTQRIPADGTYYDASIRGMAVLVPDLAQNREVLKKYLTDTSVTTN